MTSSPRRLCKCRDGRGRRGGSASSASLQKACCPRDLLLTPVHVHRRELREKIQPEILELIKQQRLNRLCEGSSFRKIGNRRRQGELRAWALGLSVPTARSCRTRGAGGHLPGQSLPGAGREQVVFLSLVCPGLSRKCPCSPAWLPLCSRAFLVLPLGPEPQGPALR